jgi:hypothetical protein
VQAGHRLGTAHTLDRGAADPIRRLMRSCIKRPKRFIHSHDPATPPPTTDLSVSLTHSESGTPTLVIRKRPYNDKDISLLHKKVKTIRQPSADWESRAANINVDPNDWIDGRQKALTTVLEMKSVEMEPVNENFKSGGIDEEEQQLQISLGTHGPVLGRRRLRPFDQWDLPHIVVATPETLHEFHCARSST